VHTDFKKFDEALVRSTPNTSMAEWAVLGEHRKSYRGPWETSAAPKEACSRARGQPMRRHDPAWLLCRQKGTTSMLCTVVWGE